MLQLLCMLVVTFGLSLWHWCCVSGLIAPINMLGSDVWNVVCDVWSFELIAIQINQEVTEVALL